MKRPRITSNTRNAAMEIGKKIKNLREKNKISQLALGKKIAVPQTTISTWELGLNIPDALELFRLAEFFQIDITIFKPSASISKQKERTEVLEQIHYLEKEIQELKRKVNA